MKKILLFSFSILYFCASAFSEDDPLQDVHKSLKDQAFVVETDEDSVSDSLDRISGQIDLGFSDPEQSYQSAGHYRPGPFGRQEISEKRDQSY